MEVISGELPKRRRGFWDRLLPLRHWLGADAAGGIEEIAMFAEQGLRIGASVGIACSGSVSARERVADELLIQADRAMYEAKRAGKGRYKFADEGR
jgi:GGDEF domain-containing protein